MVTKKIDINRIAVKDEIQQRIGLNEDCTNEYAEEIRNGANFPPLIVYDDGEKLLLADGFHRLAANLQAGVETVEATIYKGTEREATLHAVAANAAHGLRRTNADKKVAVTTLLKDEEWGKWSDGQIAKNCRVSQPFVSKIRNELTQNGYEWSSTRKCADGREMETSNIGAKSPDDTPPGDDMSASGTEAEHTDDEERETDESPAEESADEVDDKSSGMDDESTPSNWTDNSSIMDETPEEQESEKEDEQQGPEDGDLTPDEEPEDIGDDESSPESKIGGSQATSIEAPDTDDVLTLKAEIIELKKTIIEKDRQIAELELEVSNLKDTVKYYEEEVIDSIETSVQEGANVANKVNDQPLSVL